MRLFVGLPIPLEVARALVRLAASIELPKGRRVQAEDIHLTLMFLGEAEESVLPLIERELATLKAPSLKLRLTGMGTFPRAGVLFADVEPSRALLQLQTKVAEGMARCGFVPEERAYRPHLTLARFRGRLRLNEAKRILPPYLQKRFDVSAIYLYRSRPERTGPRYEVLAYMDLAKIPERET